MILISVILYLYQLHTIQCSEVPVEGQKLVYPGNILKNKIKRNVISSIPKPPDFESEATFICDQRGHIWFANNKRRPRTNINHIELGSVKFDRMKGLIGRDIDGSIPKEEGSNRSDQTKDKQEQAEAESKPQSACEQSSTTPEQVNDEHDKVEKETSSKSRKPVGKIRAGLSHLYRSEVIYEGVSDLVIACGVTTFLIVAYILSRSIGN